MRSRHAHGGDAAAYSLRQVVTVSLGVSLGLFVAMVALSFPTIAAGIVLGGVGVALGPRMRTWFGRVERRLVRNTRSGSASEESGYATAR